MVGLIVSGPQNAHPGESAPAPGHDSAPDPGGVRPSSADVAAIVPAFNESPDSLVRTLSALLEQTQPLDRVVVVDDASPTAVEIPSQLASRVELVRLEQNLGGSAARNHGAGLTTARYLLFVNCDVVLHPDWLERGVVFMDSNPGAGAVSGAIVPLLGSRLLRDWRLQFIETKSHRSALAGPTAVTWLVGHVMLVRRSVFEEVGGFDARFRTAREDVDFSDRVLASGYELFQLPGLVADSYEPASIDGLARKTVRNAGWDLRPRSVSQRAPCAAVKPVQPLRATASLVGVFIEQLGRDIVKRRFRFVPVDAAICSRGLVLVWRSWRETRGTSGQPPQ